MGHTVGILAPGAMGSAVGGRLVRHGVTVLTSLRGRSAASRARAQAAGMQDAEDERIAAKSLILSVVPPAGAIGLAERFAGKIGCKGSRAVYIDCNAISVSTVKKIGHIIQSEGARFIDVGIIGAPPKDDDPGPTIYVSGDLIGDIPDALSQLENCGLKIARLDGPVGTASALKLSYAGITKGLTALGTAMILAADRAGTGQALKAELAASQPQLLERFSKGLPDMLPKAYRWVDEMQSISDFIGKEFPECAIFSSGAELYAHIAKDFAGSQEECSRIEMFFNR